MKIFTTILVALGFVATLASADGIPAIKIQRALDAQNATAASASAAASSASSAAASLITVTNSEATTTAAKIVATNASTVATAQAAIATAQKVIVTNAVKAVVGSLSAVATPDANGGTNVVVVTAKDLNGDTLAGRTAFECWIADTEYGAVAAVAGDFAVSGGTEIQQVVDKGHYKVGTAAAGTVTLTITDTPGGTNYLHCISGVGTVTSTEMKFDVP